MAPPTTPRAGRKRAPQHHIGKLAHGRVGEPAFQIVLAQRDQRGDHDGRGGDRDQPLAARHRAQKIEAEDVDQDLEHREHAGLDHRHRVQERAHRRGRHHRRRQPAVERHERRLADAEHVEHQQHGGCAFAHGTGENSALLEVERPHLDPGPEDREELQQDRRRQQDPEVGPAGAPRLVGAAVSHQRIGGERQRLVEQEEREHVAGEGDADGAAERHREADVVAGPVALLVGADVADRIDRRRDPEERRDQREQHPERLEREGDGEPRHDVEERDPGRFAGHDRRRERDDQAEERDRGDHGDRLLQHRPPRRRRDQERACQRHSQGGEDLRRVAHGAPSSTAAARPAMPTVRSVWSPK